MLQLLQRVGCLAIDCELLAVPSIHCRRFEHLTAVEGLAMHLRPVMLAYKEKHCR